MYSSYVNWKKAPPGMLLALLLPKPKWWWNAWCIPAPFPFPKKALNICAASMGWLKPPVKKSLNEWGVCRFMFIVQKFCNAKEVCNRGLTYQPALARKSGESILEFGSKIDIDLVIIFLLGTWCKRCCKWSKNQFDTIKCFGWIDAKWCLSANQSTIEKL